MTHTENALFSKKNKRPAQKSKESLTRARGHPYDPMQADGSMLLRGANEVTVKTSAALEQLWRRALASRATQATSANSQSSRSHAVLTLETLSAGGRLAILSTRTLARCCCLVAQPHPSGLLLPCCPHAWPWFGFLASEERNPFSGGVAHLPDMGWQMLVDCALIARCRVWDLCV